MSHFSWEVPSLRHPAAETVLLVLLVAVCWLGVLGMWRMREPMQALHYLSLPASAGGILLAIAVFLEEGSSQISWKTLLIAGVLFAINSVGAHATARAFRARELGHWEPLDGDSVEFVRDSPEHGGRS
jgi:monovalent cation/proton antiporter MnhG/PhaG subunit